MQLKISIHSARVGGDSTETGILNSIKISIHSARVGGDPRSMVYMSRRSRFQSTPPVWAETHGHKGNAKKHNNFNPLRPCGRRPSPCRVHAVPNRISIHSARVGGDAAVGVVHNFTAPISIHSARVGGDIAAQILFAPHLDFNPLRPCGRRQDGGRPGAVVFDISIHSARVGGDSKRNHFFVS